MNYELADGTVIEDDETEHILRLLDKIDPIGEDITQSLNEERTLREFCKWKPNTRWCPQIKSLILETTNDSFIERSGDEELYQLLMKFNQARQIWAQKEIELANKDDNTERKRDAEAYYKYTSGTNKASALKNVVSMFCKTQIIEDKELNKEPTVIGTPAGVVDLDMEMLLTDDSSYKEDAKKFHVTKRTRGEIESRFNQSPKYDKRWDIFVNEIMCGDEELVDYLQRALGYSIIGGNPEECMFIAYGASTRNGKGTLLNTIAHVLGDYAASMPSDFLTRSRNKTSADDDALGSLDGIRFVTMSEPTAGKLLDEAKVKALTGNDMIVAARKYCPTTRFEPQFTMWLMCNRLPKVDDTSVFTSGRIRVIPFERHFDESEQDHTLKAHFRTEDGMYTVLTWLLEGYRKYKEHGLAEPPAIKRATKLWSKAGGDDFQKFIDTKCVIDNSAKVVVSKFYKIYDAWATANDCEKFTQKEIKKRLLELSIPSGRSTGGNTYFLGINIREEYLFYDHSRVTNNQSSDEKTERKEVEEDDFEEEKSSKNKKSTIRLGKRVKSSDTSDS